MQSSNIVSNASVSEDVLNPTATVAPSPLTETTASPKKNWSNLNYGTEPLLPPPRQKPREADLQMQDLDAVAVSYRFGKDGDVSRTEALPGDVSTRRILRNTSSFLTAFMKNPDDEGAAMRAGFALYSWLHPNATAEDCIQAMKMQVFGQGTDSPRNFTNRLFEFFGSNKKVLEYAEALENGSLTIEEAKAIFESDESVEAYQRERTAGPVFQKWETPKSSSDLAKAFRETLFHSGTANDYRWLRESGFSTNETLAVLDGEKFFAIGDRSYVEENFPKLMKKYGISPDRYLSVLGAIQERLPEDDGGLFARYSDRMSNMVLDIGRKLSTSAAMKQISDWEKMYGGIMRGEAVNAGDLAALRVGAGGEWTKDVLAEAEKAGANLNIGFGNPTLDEKSSKIIADLIRQRFEAKKNETLARSAVQAQYVKKFVGDGTFGASVADNAPGVLEGAGLIAVTLVNPLAGVPLTAGVYGSQTYGASATEAFAQGAEPDAALRAGAISATGEAALEMLPLGNALKVARNFVRFGGKVSARSMSKLTDSDLARVFVPESLVGKTVRVGKEAAGTVLTEFGTEMLQEGWSSGAVAGAVNGDWFSTDGAVDGMRNAVDGDFITQVLSVSLAGHGMAKAKQHRNYRESVKLWASVHASDAKGFAEAERAYLGALKNATAEAMTLKAIATIDRASDQRAFGTDGKLTGDMQSFVHNVMEPTVDESGLMIPGYSREWDSEKKKEFLKEKNGGHAVPSAMVKTFDLLHAASEVAGEQIRGAQKFAQKSTEEKMRPQVEQILDEEAEADGDERASETAIPAPRIAEDGRSARGAATLSDEHLAELTKRFLSENRKMGDGDISAELRVAFLGEKIDGADSAVVAALRGVADRAGSAYEFLSWLDAYGDSCDAELKTRTDAKNRAARLLYYGFNHVGVLSRPDTNYGRVVRLAQTRDWRNRKKLSEFSVAQKKIAAKMLVKLFPGTQVQIGGVPAWASEQAKARIEAGEINGLYTPGKIWIGENAFAGTALHEGVWHATWGWAKANSPELFRQMKEYVRRAPAWLRDEIESRYEAVGKAPSYEEISDEIGAFLFENEFEGDFAQQLDEETRSWWSGLKKLFTSAQKKLRGKLGDGTDAHDVVRNVMLDFMDGKVSTDDDEKSTPEAIESAVPDTNDSSPENEISWGGGVDLYHGSRHKYAPEAGAPMGRFRNDKIGSGEGAQFLGWGHYLTAENSIARWYAETLARLATEKETSSISQQDEENAVAHDDAIQNIEQGDSSEPRRHVYTVRLREDLKSADMLDWIAPLTDEQRARIVAMKNTYAGNRIDVDRVKYDKNLTAKDLHLGDVLGKYLTPRQKSELLYQAGFVGHKFPARTRGSGDYSKGTNYVIYDEKELNITDVERYSAAAAMNRTGTIPGDESVAEVAAGIEANNSIVLKQKIPAGAKKEYEAWVSTKNNTDRRALAKALMDIIPEGQRRFTLPDGSVIEILPKGVADLLQHLSGKKKNDDKNHDKVFSLQDCVIEFVAKIPAFMENAKEFYSEVKKGELHRNFGGVVDFNGEQRYVCVTFRETLAGLRLKSMNSRIKNELGGKKVPDAEKNSNIMNDYTTKLNVMDVLKWIVENQEKSRGDLRKVLNGENERASLVGVLGDGGLKERSDIEAQAKANGTWLKAPNGKPSKLDARQWVEVRTKAFKDWFGDWEKPSRIEKLKQSKPIEISGTEIEFTGDLKEDRKGICVEAPRHFYKQRHRKGNPGLWRERKRTLATRHGDTRAPAVFRGNSTNR